MRNNLLSLFGLLMLIAITLPPDPAAAQTAFNAGGPNGGSVIVGWSSDSCVPGIAGAIRYSSTTKCPDHSAGIAWATGNSDTGADSSVNGRANGKWLAHNDTLSSFPAAELCENLVVHGHDDWFLPSRYELDVLYQNRIAITGLEPGSTGLPQKPAMPTPDDKRSTPEIPPQTQRPTVMLFAVCTWTILNRNKFNVG